MEEIVPNSNSVCAQKGKRFIIKHGRRDLSRIQVQFLNYNINFSIMSLLPPDRFKAFLRRGLTRSGAANSQNEDRLMTPVLSLSAMKAMANHIKSPIDSTFPMVGLLGCAVPSSGDDERINSDSDDSGFNNIDPIFLNINSPWSMFICGSQGSGKSHSLSCVLESSLLKHPDLGQLSQPLAGLVFNYDKSRGSSVAEAATLCSHLKVRVLVSPCNFRGMKTLYEALPHAEGNLVVEKFHLLPKHLNTERMMRLMAVGQQGDQMPLYMQVSYPLRRLPHSFNFWTKC